MVVVLLVMLIPGSRHSVFNVSPLLNGPSCIAAWLTIQGDSVSITWKGKDIGVYGARRDNHVSFPDSHTSLLVKSNVGR